MQYNYITQYFARLQNRSLLFSLVSMLLFSLEYYFILSYNLTNVKQDDFSMLASGLFAIVAVMDGIVSKVLVVYLLKKARGFQSLGDRLDRYDTINLIRFGVLTTGTCMLMLSLYYGRSIWLLAAFMLYVLFFVAAWPTRKRVCKELQLTQNEQEVIFER